MSLRTSKQSDRDWGWLRETDSTPADDLSVTGIGVIAVHFHRLIIEEPFRMVTRDKSNSGLEQSRSINAFRLCLSAYALNRFSKTVRMTSNRKGKNIVEFNETMQLMTRIYDKRHDIRHSIHVILYGYLKEEKRYGLIAEHVVDSIQLVSIRHISEAIVFESSSNIMGKATLLVELVFVYGRHGYNFSSQLIFQTDMNRSDTLRNQTLFEHAEINDQDYFITDETSQSFEAPKYLTFSFDQLNDYVGAHRHHGLKNDSILQALSTSPKYSSMTALLELCSTRKQRLELLFDFLTDGPHIPEQNIIEPAGIRLIPWSLAYWKRNFAGLPLHGNTLDVHDCQVTDSNVSHFANTSPLLRQIFSRDATKSFRWKEILRQFLTVCSNVYQSYRR